MRTRWIFASLILGCSAAPDDVVVAPDTDAGPPRDAGFAGISDEGGHAGHPAQAGGRTLQIGLKSAW